MVEKQKVSTTAGFEPARVEPSNLAGYRLNHSATLSSLSLSSLYYLKMLPPFEADLECSMHSWPSG